MSNDLFRHRGQAAAKELTAALAKRGFDLQIVTYEDGSYFVLSRREEEITPHFHFVETVCRLISDGPEKTADEMIATVENFKPEMHA